jgi:3-oxoadipate enol-lactonase
MQFVNINGHTIHYRYLTNSPLGGGGGITFLFINSLGTDFRIWDDIVETLKVYGNILLFDKRGHGLSDVVENTNGLDDFTDDVIALIQYLSIEKCIPVGLSVGGMIAQILARRIPRIIEKLIFCDTSFKIGIEQTWNDRIITVKQNGITAISNSVMQKWFSEKFRKENEVKVSGYKNMLERIPAPGYIKTCEAIRDADLKEIAQQIKIPSLCVVGSEDKSTPPEVVKDLADVIEGSGFKVIEDSGHIPCVDNPQALSKLIIDFIR